MDTVEELDYKKLWEQEKKKTIALEGLLSRFEANGNAKLYYALNRKASEMADLLNANNLEKVVIDDAKDKTFERLEKIWKGSSDVSAAINNLGMTAGVTGDQDKDIARKPFVDTIADSRK